MKKCLVKKSFKISGNVVRKNTEYVCDEELATRLEKEGYLKIIGDVVDKESKKSNAKVQKDSDSDNNLNDDKNKSEDEPSSNLESNHNDNPNEKEESNLEDDEKDSDSKLIEDDDPKEDNDIETATLNKKEIKANKKKRIEFYKSTAWKTVKQNIWLKQSCLCARCKAAVFVKGISDDNIPIKKRLKGIVHHIIYLTDDNYDDPNISLNEKYLEGLCIDCHNKEHFKTNSGVRDDLTFDEYGNLIKK